MKKAEVLIALFLSAVFLLNFISAEDGEKMFVAEENIQPDSCSEGYTEASSFIDGNGATQKLCVIKSPDAEGGIYVVSSSISKGGINCTAGQLTGRFSSRIEEGLQDVILCVEKSAGENKEVFLTDVSIAEVCPSKFKESGSFVNSDGNLVFHCIKENSEKGAKIILGTSSIVIIVVLIILIIVLFKLFNSSRFSFSK